MKYFEKTSSCITRLRLTASTAITPFESAKLHRSRQLNVSFEQVLTSLEKLPYSIDCFSWKKRNSTIFRSATSNVPIYKPTLLEHSHDQKITVSKKWNQKKKIDYCCLAALWPTLCHCLGSKLTNLRLLHLMHAIGHTHTHTHTHQHMCH